MNSPLLFIQWRIDKRRLGSLEGVTKGWISNEEANLRRFKKLLEEYDKLDVKSKTSDLFQVEFSKLKFIHSELQKIWLQEETKAKQRSRHRDIKEGERNTTYFHAVANQRRRKTFIHTLDSPNGPVTEINDMLGVASSYYKDLFKLESMGGYNLNRDFFSPLEKKCKMLTMSCQKHHFLKLRLRNSF